MSSAPKRGRYDSFAAATAQYYNTTGIVLSQLCLPPDISYLISNQPSCTIVVSELPSGCTDHDLIGLFSRYGQVKGTQLVCSGRAALVEFCDISTPTRLVHISKTNPFFVGARHVRLEFSSQTIIPSNTSKPVPDKSTSGNKPTHILHLDIAAADYPITVDVLKAICTPYGKLQRVFIGKKNVDRSLEALVEFQTVQEAEAAKEQLDGADIYSGCCSLTVTFSQLPKVHVTKNDSESWDFTGPNASVPGPLNSSSNQRTLLSTSFAMGNTSSSPVIQTAASPAPPCLPPAPPSVNTMYPKIFPPPFPVTPQMACYSAPPYAPTFSTPPTYGMVTPAPCVRPMLYSNRNAQGGLLSPRPALLPSTQPQLSSSLKVIILPTPTLVHPVSATGIGLGHATSNLSASVIANRQTDLSIFESIEGVVLMACNLPLQLNCDHLFNLLCLYGNIARIKFLKTRPGCAMIQVGTAEAADLIHRYYNSVKIFDRTIQFYHSKQSELTEHENLGKLDDGSPVMKNYMADPNNRFRNVVVASRSRILAPSRTLHFFNTPLCITPEDIADIFTNAGVVCPPRIVVFTSKSAQKTSLGLAEWDTVSEALEALALVNHFPIHVSGVSHPYHMKLAFSPKPISNDRTGQALIRYAAPKLPAVTNPSPTTTPTSESGDANHFAEDINETPDSHGSDDQASPPRAAEPDPSVTAENKSVPTVALSDTNGGCTTDIKSTDTESPISAQDASVDSAFCADSGLLLEEQEDSARLDHEQQDQTRPQLTSSDESPTAECQ